MPEFLIHRNADGRIVLAVPYANIMEAKIFCNTYPEDVGGEYSFMYLLNIMHGSTIHCSQADAERYLSEWREWWERKANHDQVYSSAGLPRHGELKTIKCGKMRVLHIHPSKEEEVRQQFPDVPLKVHEDWLNPDYWIAELEREEADK